MACRERSMTCHSRSRKSLTLHRIKSEDKTGGGYGGGGGKFPFYDSTFNCLVFPSYVRLSGSSVYPSRCRSDSHIATSYLQMLRTVSSFNSFQFVQHFNAPAPVCGLNVVRISSVTFFVHASLSLSSDRTNCTHERP
jgi:hypothetical protein